MNAPFNCAGSSCNPTVLVTVSHFPPAFLGGGPARTLDAMVQHSRAPERIAIITSDTDHGVSEPLNVHRNRWVRRGGPLVRYTSLRRPVQLARAMSDGRKMRPRYVYINSMFHPRLALLPLVLARLRWWGDAQIVIAPRGEADAGALAIKARKKQAFLTLAKWAGLYRNVSWHASSRREAEAIEALGIDRGRILVKVNETLLPLRALRRKVASAPAGDPLLLHVGRISRKKQLEILLEALERVTQPFRLQIIGECDDPAYEQELRVLSDRLGNAVDWLGAVDHDSVFKYYERAAWSCFPTAGENFGHVIAESLSRGCPVLVADVTPWTSVVIRGGGRIVGDSSVDAWVATLESVLARGTFQESHDRAADAFDEWRAGQDTVSFFDYLLENGQGDLQADRDLS